MPELPPTQEHRGIAQPLKPLRLLDLFSGIGGFSLGLERAGFQTVAFCEISPKCRHLLKNHWPDVPAYDDICTLTAERLAADGIAVDAICGGFPCQDISFAGAGAGIEGARSGLWREYARLIRELRPAVVVVENVAALTSRGLGVVLGDLALLGYDAEWDRIRAADVGAPHLRARLWIVAYARGQQHQGFGDAFRRALAAELPEAFHANTGLCAGDDAEADAQHPDAHGLGSHRAEVHELGGPELRHEQVGQPRSLGEHVADAAGKSEREPANESDAFAASRAARYEPRGRREHQALPDTDRQRLEGCGLPEDIERPRADPERRRPEGGWSRLRSRGWWATEPDVGRTLDGFSAWLDEAAGESEAHKVILAYANAADPGPRKALRDLRDRIRAEDDRRAAGGSISVSPAEVLFAFVREHARRAEEGFASLEGSAPQADSVRGVRGEKSPARSPLRSRRDEQRACESSDPLQVVSQLLARDAEAAWISYRWPDAWASQPWVHGWEDGIARVAHGVPARVDRLHGLGNAVVPEIPFRLGRAILTAMAEQRAAA